MRTLAYLFACLFDALSQLVCGACARARWRHDAADRVVAVACSSKKATNTNTMAPPAKKDEKKAEAPKDDKKAAPKKK